MAFRATRRLHHLRLRAAATRKTRDATHRLISGIDAIDGLHVLGHPDSSLVRFVADEVDLFEVADELRARGWYVQPQLAFGSLPRNLHLTVTAASQDRVEPLLADLAVAVEARGRGRSRTLPQAWPWRCRHSIPPR